MQELCPTHTHPQLDVHTLHTHTHTAALHTQAGLCAHTHAHLVPLPPHRGSMGCRHSTKKLKWVSADLSQPFTFSQASRCFKRSHSLVAMCSQASLSQPCSTALTASAA